MIEGQKFNGERSVLKKDLLNRGSIKEEGNLACLHLYCFTCNTTLMLDTLLGLANDARRVEGLQNDLPMEEYPL
jgi:hypothetical protein